MPLTGVYSKLARAKELIDQIAEEEKSFLPSAVRAEETRSKDGKEFRLHVFAQKELPQRFSILAGEVVHQLRSSLDHIVWAIALRNTPNPAQRLQFPIFKTDSDFNNALNNLRDIGTTAIDIIRAMQPYNADEPVSAGLAVLQSLNNADKHRLLIVTMTAAEIGNDVGVIPGSTPVEIARIWGGERVNVTAQGALAFAIDFSAPSLDVKIEPSLDLKIVFEKAGDIPSLPLVQGLRQLLEGVSDDVEKLAPLLA